MCYRRLFGLLFCCAIVFSTGCKHRQKENYPNATHQNEQSKSIDGQLKQREKVSQPEVKPFQLTDTTKLISNTYHVENIGNLLSKTSILNETAHVPKKLNHNFIQNKREEFSIGTTSSINRYFIIDFENDIFTNTDYYFTNGMQISMIAPFFENIGLNRTLPGLGRNAMNYYGAGIRQNMYTGINPETEEIDRFDRPFAGVLYLEIMKYSYNSQHKLRLTSSIRTGVLGSNSLASSLQGGLHDLKPTGWQYQVQNDIILNLQAQLEKGIINRRNLEIITSGNTRIGTLNTDIGGSILLRAGQFKPYFEEFYTSKLSSGEYTEDKKWNYWISLEAGQQFVFYNATLNGGLFRKDSPFVLKYNELQHAVTRLTIGISCFYKQNGLVLSYVQLSPEFKNGRMHRWGSIRLIRNF
ncbi:MAG: lipid A deacylase LpxR family protein [Bacteroidales bacterium]|nr:lipid A deacylase LpxR family protein [Bacteroidales bacterium]